MSSKNKAFWKKTKENQRVAVAKDVIAQIKANFMVACRKTYFKIRKLRNAIENPDPQLDKLFSQLKSEKATCEVCGIGSCFVSLVNLGDAAKTQNFIDDEIVQKYDNIDDDDMRKVLRKVFPDKQIELIECAFEKSYMFGDHLSNVQIWEAVSFGAKYMKDRARLIAIMENIIKNKGTFLPHKG